MHSIVTIDSKTALRILVAEAAKRVNLKSSHNKKNKICNCVVTDSD